MTEIERLENEFNADMLGILAREGEIGINSIRFCQMIERYGGIGAARRLLEPDRELPTNTFGYLRGVGRLDLAMEYYVVKEKYRPLFRDDEREIAQWRLDKGD